MDDNGKTQVNLLDIDGSLSTTTACAKAIEFSMEKIAVNGEALVLNGQTTDSGGGGVLDKLAEELSKLNLCVENDYFVAACAIHCFQLQLSRPVKELIGEGAIGARNAMQLVATINVLQGYLSWPVVKATMTMAQEFHDEWYDKDYEPDPTNKGDVEFAVKWNKVRLFRDFDPIGDETKWSKCPACILTRWQYVGAANKYAFDYYLLLVKWCQILINSYTANNQVNKAASDLQSLLLEGRLYNDICLVKCFHDSYFQAHLNWLMQSNDLTKVCGFQAHQMAVRYYLMESTLEEMSAQVNDVHSFFDHFILSLQHCGEHYDAQKGKAAKFVDIALESLHKHFSRWVQPQLLPAALLAEKPLALVAARAITGTPAPPPVLNDSNREIMFLSPAHCMNIKPSTFDFWFRSKMELYASEELMSAWTPHVKSAATLLLSDGVDLRSVDSFKAHDAVKELWRTYLALASHTQFVERGVKEAKLVASTNREEQQRSAYAIIRSCNVHCEEITDNTSAPDRVKYLIANVESAVARKDALIDQVNGIGEELYNAAFELAKEKLTLGHFKEERIGGVIDGITATAEQNKASNVRQKTSGVQLTLESMGLIAYSKVRKGPHLDALKAELTHRQFDGWLHSEEHETKPNQPLTFTELKNALKAMELKRIELEFPKDELAKQMAEKGFLQLSEVVFDGLS